MDLTGVFNNNYLDLMKSISKSQDEAFYICDLNTIIHQHKTWTQNLPLVQPYFAIKSNPDPMVIKILYGLGCGFDCASMNEVNLVLSLGIPQGKIIFANPCKIRSHILHVKKFDLTMTIDNLDELKKIQDIHPKAKLMLRLKTDDQDSKIQLSKKFGAALFDLDLLLQLIANSEMQFLGFSFHSGSGCTNPNVFHQALQDVKTAIEIANDYSLKTKIVDIGGGYPGIKNSPLFKDIAMEINQTISELQFDGAVQFIAEPGKFFVEAAFYLAVNIHSKRSLLKEGAKSFMYYVDEGIYGSFNIRNLDGIKVQPKILSPSRNESKLYPCSIWGPTCDSIDCLFEEVLLPKLSCGDWLYYDNFGDYTICSGTNFNGFDKPKIYYTFSD